MLKYKYYTNSKELENIFEVEKQIFDTQKFNTKTAVFPENVFNKKFSYFAFLEYNFCFRETSDYKKLISFLSELNLNSFIVSCPRFYQLNPVEIFINCDFETFNDIITFNTQEFLYENLKGTGYFDSPEIFMYDKHKQWAMLHDMINNMVIVGYNIVCMKDYFPNFYTNFFHLFTNEGREALGITQEIVDEIDLKIKLHYS